MDLSGNAIAKKKSNQTTLEALWRVEKVILDTLDFNKVVQKIVDSVLLELGYMELGYRIVVLALVDEDSQTLKRISISRTAEAKKALSVTPIPFRDINIPLSAKQNLCVKSVSENKPYTTHDWVDILCPPYFEKEAKEVQRIVGIKTSMVYPVYSKGKGIGVLIFSMVKDESEVMEEEKELIQGFTDIVGLAVENAQLYSSLQEQSKELDIANKKLVELDNLKDEFVSVASHELRTPMTAIKSFLWMALNRQVKNMNPDLKRYLDKAYISTERLINLVNDMLNISRIEGGRIALKLKETNLVQLASEVYEELVPKAQEKGVSLSVDKIEVPKVLCDGDKIHEVFMNLIGNSLKFTLKGGRVWIGFRTEGDMVFVEVWDTGRGLAADEVPKLFTKFGRLDNSFVSVAESGGTGLGLYISKSLVELHKGKIGAESEGMGRGSKFSFSLPIVGTTVAKQLMQDAPKPTEGTKELEKTKVTI